jgi:hypothetical protein
MRQASLDISLIKGRLRLERGEYPTIGDPKADHIVALMFDYTCIACRKMHEYLYQAIERYNDRLAVVILPVPLDKTCNKFRKKSTTYLHVNACLFAKMALAIWEISPQAFISFDSFMFRDEYPPDAATARQFAEKLLGKTKLNEVMNQAIIDKRLQVSIRFFYTPLVREQVIPLLLTAEQINYRVPVTLDSLYHLLEKQLQLKPDSSVNRVNTKS